MRICLQIYGLACALLCQYCRKSRKWSTTNHFYIVSGCKTARLFGHCDYNYTGIELRTHHDRVLFSNKKAFYSNWIELFPVYRVKIFVNKNFARKYDVKCRIQVLCPFRRKTQSIHKQCHMASFDEVIRECLSL